MMRKYFYVLLLFLAVFISLSCAKDEKEPEDPYKNLAALEISPKYDTLFITIEDEPKTVSLKGRFANSTTNVSSNSGVITGVEWKTIAYGTTYSNVPSADAKWSSSKPEIVVVGEGVITAKSSGLSLITAKINNVTTSALNVQVVLTDSAPGLTLDPPDTALVFQDNITVSGIVQIIGTAPNSTKLSIKENKSGYNNQNVSYDVEGRFSNKVLNLQSGFSSVLVTAEHPTNGQLKTEKQKFVYYYVFGTSEADSIVGRWEGTTAGQVFHFNIVKNSILQRYDITGKMDIRFEGIVYTKDIEITGLVNSDGTIDISLSGKYEGFTISGSLTGYFTNTGYGSGDYSAEAKGSGWPTLGFDEKWTAVKVE